MKNFGIMLAKIVQRKEFKEDIKVTSRLYRIRIDKFIVAEGMRMEHVMIFVKGLFDEYHNDNRMTITIERMDKDSPEQE